MKNETVGAKKAERKAGLSAATLPGWAKALIAQQYSPDLCSECSVKIRTPQGGN